MSLEFAERAAGDAADGLLVLHHGRGSHELDLLGLADVLDPERRLHVVAPRAPMTLPESPGFHWYKVPRVGHPDRESFDAAFAELAAFHEDLWERTGIGPERTLLGGFSMGAVMSYATGLAAARPAPAGILAFSGFMPTVESWTPDFASRPRLPLFVAHGDADPVISIDFARGAKQRIEAAGLPLEYHEFPGGHFIDPALLPPAAAFVARTTSADV